MKHLNESLLSLITFGLGLLLVFASEFSHEIDHFAKFQSECAVSKEGRRDRFSIRVEVSDYAVSGTGTKDDPFVIDEVLLNLRLRALDELDSPARVVIEGGCHAYAIESPIVMPQRSNSTLGGFYFDYTNQKLPEGEYKR